MFGLGWSVAAALPLLFTKGMQATGGPSWRKDDGHVERACECPHQYITRLGAVLRTLAQLEPPLWCGIRKLITPGAQFALCSSHHCADSDIESLMRHAPSLLTANAQSTLCAH